MALGDFFSNLQLLIRWLHVMAGIVWIGHLYFFNFVNIPFQGTIGGDVKKVVNPQLMTRALWWFRWGAMITFLAGLLLFVTTYLYAPGLGFGFTELFLTQEGMTDRAMWILMGMLFGIVMWFNVWFIHLAGAEEAAPGCARRCRPGRPPRQARAARVEDEHLSVRTDALRHAGAEPLRRQQYTHGRTGDRPGPFRDLVVLQVVAQGWPGQYSCVASWN